MEKTEKEIKTENILRWVTAVSMCVVAVLLLIQFIVS